MCIASHWPAGVQINYEALMNGAEVNDDGHGFAIGSKSLGLEVFRSMRFEETIEALEDARDRHGDNSVVIFHSRWATHGVTSEYNVHPFYTDSGGETVVVHNGVLPGRYHPTGSDPRSDTRIFADRILADYTINGVPSRRQSRALGSLIGSGNKLIFLSVVGGEPKVRIVNSHLGENAYGAWFSNSGYLPSRWSWRGWKDEALSLGRADDPQSMWADIEEDYNTLMCEGCEGIGGIDPETDVCGYCDTCHLCGASYELCMCYSALWKPTPTSIERY